MPIKSYLAYPGPGKRDELAAQMQELPDCEVVSSTTHDVPILVTDTDTEDAEAALEAQLPEVAGIACLALVSGAEPHLIEVGAGE